MLSGGGKVLGLNADPFAKDGADIGHWQVAGESFVLDSKYKVLDYLGSGAYGVVCSAHDRDDNCTVAIKKCKKVLSSRTLAKRTLREIRLLRNMSHENVVRVKTLIKPVDTGKFSDLYIVFEIMETDLAQIIRSPQLLKDQHVQYFTFQLLAALRYIHSVDIMHRDIKPRNLLVNSNCCLKLADFGLARMFNQRSCSKTVAMTEYVTTRWYRAPEVLVGWGQYTTAIDMWAVGCIIAELIGRSPIFPGADSFKQMQLICQCTGKPSSEFINSCRKEQFRNFLIEMPPDVQAVDLAVLYGNANPLALDLTSKLLRVNPAERLSAADALKHSYFLPLTKSKAKRSDQTHNSSFGMDIFKREQFAFEERKLSIENLRDELLYEVNFYNTPFQSPDSMYPSLFTPPESRPIAGSSSGPMSAAVAGAPEADLRGAAVPEGKKTAGVCCVPSLLGCVDSDYSVSGFDTAAADTAVRADAITTAEEVNGTVKVRQQDPNGTSPLVDDRRPKKPGLRSLPPFVAETSEEKLRLQEATIDADGFASIQKMRWTSSTTENHEEERRAGSGATEGDHEGENVAPEASLPIQHQSLRSDAPQRSARDDQPGPAPELIDAGAKATEQGTPLRGLRRDRQKSQKRPCHIM